MTIPCSQLITNWRFRQWGSDIKCHWAVMMAGLVKMDHNGDNALMTLWTQSAHHWGVIGSVICLFVTSKMKTWAGNLVLVSGVVECCHIWKSGGEPGEPGCGDWGGEPGKYWAIIRLSSSGHVKMWRSSSSHKFSVYLEHSFLLSSFCSPFFSY